MKNKLLRFSAVAFCLSAVIFVATCFFAAYSLFGDIREDKIRVTVPNFVGRVADEIADNGFEIEKNYVFDEDVPRGVVVSQSPSAGKIRKGDPGEQIEVELKISLGKRQEKMPDLRGLDSRAALIEARLFASSLGAVATVEELYDTGYAPDKVVKTEPQAGAQVSSGDEIVLYVSRKKSRDSVTVPNVLGLEREEAIHLLEDAGLIVLECEGGRVLSQSIPFGSVVLRDTEILLECAGTEENTTEEPWWFFGRQ